MNVSDKYGKKKENRGAAAWAATLGRPIFQRRATARRKEEEMVPISEAIRFG